MADGVVFAAEDGAAATGCIDIIVYAAANEAVLHTKVYGVLLAAAYYAHIIKDAVVAATAYHTVWGAALRAANGIGETAAYEAVLAAVGQAGG